MTQPDALHWGSQTQAIMGTIEWFKCFFGAVYEGASILLGSAHAFRLNATVPTSPG